MKAAQTVNQEIASTRPADRKYASNLPVSLMFRKGLAEVGQDAERRVGSSLADVFNLAKPVVGLAAKPEGKFSGDLKGEMALSAKLSSRRLSDSLNISDRCR